MLVISKVRRCEIVAFFENYRWRRTLQLREPQITNNK